jgi:hypothetical protein
MSNILTCHQCICYALNNFDPIFIMLSVDLSSNSRLCKFPLPTFFLYFYTFFLILIVLAFKYGCKLILFSVELFTYPNSLGSAKTTEIITENQSSIFGVVSFKIKTKRNILINTK